MEKARCNTELYSNLRAPLNNVKPSNFLGSHQSVSHPLVSLREIRIELSMIGFLTIEMSILKYSNNSLINMNTLRMLKKCIQIDLSEYT